MDFRAKAHGQKHSLEEIIDKLRREQGPSLIHPGFIPLMTIRSKGLQCEKALFQIFFCISNVMLCCRKIFRFPRRPHCHC